MKIPEKNAEQTSNDFQKGFNVGMQMNYMESTRKNKPYVVSDLILAIFKRHSDTSDISDPKDQELFALLIEQELKLKKLLK